MGKAVPFSTGRETRGILALRLQRHAKSWGSAVYQGSLGQGIGITWLLIHWRKLRMPSSGEHAWLRQEVHVYMWCTIREFVYKYWTFVLEADNQPSQHKHSTTQSSAINQKPLFNMQFSTSFLVAALFGTAFAMPQANPTDCPETSAIPTCGVSHSSKAAVFQVLTVFWKAPCITSAASAVGCSNIACQCASSSAIQASAINCVLDNCGFLEALQVQASAAAVCTACA